MKQYHFDVSFLCLFMFVGMLVKSWIMETWAEDCVELLSGALGVICCLFPEESTFGYWGWSHRQWRTPPIGWTKFVGIVLVLLAAYCSFTGSKWLDEMVTG